MTDKEAMQMALEALEDLVNGWKCIRSTHGDLYGVGWDRAEGKGDTAITTLREALTQPKGEPQMPSAKPVPPTHGRREQANVNPPPVVQQIEPHKDAFDKLVEAAYRRGRREERLEALTQKQESVAWVDTLREAFFDGFCSVATYNDTLLNSADEEWENHKQYYTTPPVVQQDNAPSNGDKHESRSISRARVRAQICDEYDDGEYGNAADCCADSNRRRGEK